MDLCAADLGGLLPHGAIPEGQGMDTFDVTLQRVRVELQAPRKTARRIHPASNSGSHAHAQPLPSEHWHPMFQARIFTNFFCKDHRCCWITGVSAVA